MFSRWLKSLTLGRQQSSVSAALPEGYRVYAVGDIHGRADLLRGLATKIEADLAEHPVDNPVVVFLGDYVDRGPDSKDVIEFLLDWRPADVECVYLKGNHEEALLNFLADARSGSDWRQFGGLETLISYGVPQKILGDKAENLEPAREAFAARLPERHLAFLQRLETLVPVGDYLFVHAGIRPNVPIDMQVSADLLWIRDEFLSSTVDHGYVVVHGHTPVEQPDSRPNRIGVDTGAYATGILTCVCLEGDERRFLSTSSGRADTLPDAEELVSDMHGS